MHIQKLKINALFDPMQGLQLVKTHIEELQRPFQISGQLDKTIMSQIDCSQLPFLTISLLEIYFEVFEPLPLEVDINQV